MDRVTGAAVESLRELFDLARAQAATVGLVLTWAVLAWAYLRKRRDWSRKQFRHHVNFSLSYVLDGLLTIRTLVEMPAQQVWLNDRGVEQVTRAAARTTAEQPFIGLDHPKDMAFLYRAALNVLSEKFAEPYLAQALGLPTRFDVFRFAVTCERTPEIRTVKIRVLVVRESDLRDTFADGTALTVPSGYYTDRLQVLRAMHALLLRQGQPGVLPLGRVVLGLRLETPAG